MLPGFFNASLIRNQVPHITALHSWMLFCSLCYPPKQQSLAVFRNQTARQRDCSCTPAILFFFSLMYIWDRRSSKYMAIYLPLLQLKLVWTITQKITFLSQFICLTLIALLFSGTVAMEMGEWSFCWYHCIIKGHWDWLGQEIIFRVQLLRGWMLFHRNFVHGFMWLLLCHPKLNQEPHWL